MVNINVEESQSLKSEISYYKSFSYFHASNKLEQELDIWMVNENWVTENEIN